MTWATQRISRLENTGLWFRKADTIFHEGKRWLVVRSEGGVFHLRLARQGRSVDGQELWATSAGKPLGSAYSSIDENMTAEDIEGATYAHDTGTHWLFAHCSPGEQIDFAAEARLYATQQFAIAIGKAQVKADMATNATAKSAAVEKVAALLDFAEAVGAHAYTVVVGATLGHFHRAPHHDHKRDLAVAAIGAVLADWKKRALTDTDIRDKRLLVTRDAAAVNAALTKAHTIEWRHERAAREEAAKKAKEAADAAEAGPEGGDGA